MTITELLAAKLAIAEAAINVIPGELESGIRRDRSMWLSIGDPRNGPHVQADWEFGPEHANLLADSRMTTPALIRALQRVAAMLHADWTDVLDADGDPIADVPCQWCLKLRPILADLARELEGK